jgi:hypothetical protein
MPSSVDSVIGASVSLDLEGPDSIERDFELLVGGDNR